MAKSQKEKAKDKAWKAFSLYIRLKYSIDEYCTCVTCGETKHYKEMQAGHFVASRCNAVLFDEKIVFPQCFRCNIPMHGNPIPYFRYMRSLGYSEQELYDMQDRKKRTIKYSMQDYLDIEEKYKGLVKLMEN